MYELKIHKGKGALAIGRYNSIDEAKWGALDNAGCEAIVIDEIRTSNSLQIVLLVGMTLISYHTEALI